MNLFFDLFSVLLGFIVGRQADSTSYTLSASYVGSGFNDAFSYDAIPDPTNGRVTYVDAATAAAQNLTFASADAFVLRTDYTTVLSASDPGRNSVRLKSNVQYTNHVAIFDVRHMPQGCATWPAIWELGDNWPAGGEIDILEGVNDNGTNAISLHTSPNCTVPASGRDQTGITETTDCDTNANGNSGCGVAATGTGTYGPSFNDNGGGWLALERSSSAVNVYFWPRTSSTVPSDVENGAGSIDTSQWGVPVANFPDTSCDFSSHLGPMNIIINLTLCGDWAGNVFNQDGCPGTCVDYVDANPAAFVNAYFEFASLNIYE